jgi:formate dehydrogenase major subunit
MDVNRRTFIKGGSGAVVASVLAFDVRPAYEQAKELKIARTTETRSACPCRSVSCGVIIHTLGDKAKNVTPQVVHVEGDPDHPVNRGTLRPKGSSLYHDILNDRRLLKPQVRRPGSDRWEDIAWDQAISEVARHIEKTRDETFIAAGSRAAPSIAARASPGMAAALRGHDQWLDRHQECRRDVDHGGQSRREPSTKSIWPISLIPHS